MSLPHASATWHKTNAVVFVLVIVLVFAPALAPLDPMASDATSPFRPPGGIHLLGTDQLGRDVLSRMLYGGRRTTLLALASTSLALSGGILLGLPAARAGALGNACDAILQALFAVPGLLLALVVITLVGGGSAQLALAVGLSQIAPVARLVQTSARGAAILPHVDAARALGATEWRVLFRHILPVISGQIGAAGALAFSYCLLNGAALSFFGLGGSPSLPDWGTMLFDGRQAFRIAPWVGFAPGLALTALVWMANHLSRQLSLQAR